MTDSSINSQQDEVVDDNDDGDGGWSITDGFSRAECYKCENTIYGIDVKAPHTAFGSHKCFVVWQNTSTCEAKKYCTKLMYLCTVGTIYPFILSSILF